MCPATSNIFICIFSGASTLYYQFITIKITTVYKSWYLKKRILPLPFSEIILGFFAPLDFHVNFYNQSVKDI